MNRRNLFLAAVLLLGSCNVVHKHKSDTITRHDSTGTLSVLDTRGVHKDSVGSSIVTSDLKRRLDSSFLNAVITAGDSGIDIEVPAAAFTGKMTGDSTVQQPVKVHLSKGSSINMNAGRKKDTTAEQKTTQQWSGTKTFDTSAHKQQQSSDVSDKQKVKTDNSKSSRIPWVGILMVAALLWLVLWTWKNKVIKI